MGEAVGTRPPGGAPQCAACDNQNELGHTYSKDEWSDAYDLLSIQGQKRMNKDLAEAAYFLSKRQFGWF